MKRLTLIILTLGCFYAATAQRLSLGVHASAELLGHSLSPIPGWSLGPRALFDVGHGFSVQTGISFCDRYSFIPYKNSESGRDLTRHYYSIDIPLRIYHAADGRKVSFLTGLGVTFSNTFQVTSQSTSAGSVNSYTYMPYNRYSIVPTLILGAQVKINDKYKLWIEPFSFSMHYSVSRTYALDLTMLTLSPGIGLYRTF